MGGRWYGYEGGLAAAEAAARSIAGAGQYWTKREGAWTGAAPAARHRKLLQGANHLALSQSAESGSCPI